MGAQRYPSWHQLLLLLLLGTCMQPSQPFTYSLGSGTQPVRVMMGIISPRKDFERRQLIRSTFMHHISHFTHIHSMFVVGLAQKDGSSTSAIKTEAKLFRDMVLVHHPDPHLNDEAQTHLLVLSFFKMAINQDVYDYIIKVDMKSYIHPFNMYRLIQALPRQRVYWGEANQAILSFNKEKIPSHFMSKHAYILSIDLVTWMVNNQAKLLQAAAEMDRLLEGKAVGLWVAMALAHMDDGRTTLPDDYQLKPSEVLPLKKKDIIDVGQNKRMWWDQNGAKKDREPCVDVAVVSNLDEEEQLSLKHQHFYSKTYYAWHTCAKLQYQPSICSLLMSKPQVKSDPSWLSDSASFFYNISKWQERFGE